jgi:hypothetical protein
MIHVMLPTLIAAGPADIGAKPAQLTSVVRAQGHELAGQPADGGALLVQRDALGHFPDVLLLQTSAGAMIANHSAIVTGVDTIFVLLVHGSSFR